MKNKDRINIYIARHMGYRVEKRIFDDEYVYFELISPSGERLVEPYYDEYGKPEGLPYSEKEAWEYVHQFTDFRKRCDKLVAWITTQPERVIGHTLTLPEMFVLNLNKILKLNSTDTVETTIKLLQATSKQISKAAFLALRLREKFIVISQDTTHQFWYGWYSEQQKSVAGSVFYTKPSGGVVEVTEISIQNKKSPNSWNDIVCVGEVDKYYRVASCQPYGIPINHMVHNTLSIL
jgi:hypothetical protein